MNIESILKIFTQPERFKKMSPSDQDKFIDDFVEYILSSKDQIKEAIGFLQFGNSDGSNKVKSIVDYIEEIGVDSFKSFLKEVLLDGRIKTSMGFINKDTVSEMPYLDPDEVLKALNNKTQFTEEMMLEQMSLCYTCEILREEQKRIGESIDERTGNFDKLKSKDVFDIEPFIKASYRLFMAFSLLGKDNSFKKLCKNKGFNMANAYLQTKNKDFLDYAAKYFKDNNIDGNTAILNCLSFCITTLKLLKPLMFNNIPESKFDCLEDLLIHLSLSDYSEIDDEYDEQLMYILSDEYERNTSDDDSDEDDDEGETIIDSILPTGNNKESKSKSSSNKNLKDLLLDD